VRIYNSVKGINNPILKVAESVNDHVDLPLMRKGVFVLHNSQDDKFKTIEGITFDGSWNSTSDHSEQQHSIWISSSNNVIIRENVFKNCLGDGISMQWSNLTYAEVGQKYSHHVIIEDNIFDKKSLIFHKFRVKDSNKLTMEERFFSKLVFHLPVLTHDGQKHLYP